MKIKDKNILKKIERLKNTLLNYANEKSMPGAWSEHFKNDFEIIEQLEYDYNINKKLFPGDMRLCNRLYKKYKL